MASASDRPRETAGAWVCTLVDHGADSGSLGGTPEERELEGLLASRLQQEYARLNIEGAICLEPKLVRVRRQRTEGTGRVETPILIAGFAIGLDMIGIFGFVRPRWTTGKRQRASDWADMSGSLLADVRQRALFAGLERSKQQWEATFDSLEDLLFILDRDGRLLKVNRALGDRLGGGARELMQSPERLFAHFGPLCAGREAEAFRWRCSTLNATFDIRCTPVEDRAGAPIGTVYILRDVTEQLLLEGHMRHRDKLAALGQMLSGIAHELNNPLTSVIGYSERLSRLYARREVVTDVIAAGSRTAGNALELEWDAKAREYVLKIAMQADRASHLSRNLLDFARAQARSHGPVALNEVVRQTLEIAADASGSQVALVLNLAAELPTILGSLQELQQVLINLLNNARQAIQTCGVGSCVTITTCVNVAGGVRLSVCDDGPGIPAEHRERLFEPFFTTKEAGEGTGLGLAICLGILRTHNASLDLQSEVGEGTCFLIDFPAFEPVPVADVGARALDEKIDDDLKAGDDLIREPGRIDRHEASTGSVQGSNSLSWRVAVVDDEPYIRELLVEMLTDMGFDAVCFDSPLRALDALESEWFDAILSDVKMPEMSGMVFFERIMAQHPEQARRTIFLTGDMLAPGTQAFIANNGVLCLSKPFLHASLEQKLMELRERLRPSQCAAE